MSTKDIKELQDAFADAGTTEIEDISTDIVPTLCVDCINNTICNPLTSHLNLFRIGIKIQIEECPYHRNS